MELIVCVTAMAAIVAVSVIGAVLLAGLAMWLAAKRAVADGGSIKRLKEENAGLHRQLMAAAHEVSRMAAVESGRMRDVSQPTPFKVHPSEPGGGEDGMDVGSF